MRTDIVKKTLRVPIIEGQSGDGSRVTRQLDTALMSVGFKLTKEVLKHFSGLHPIVVKDAAAEVLTSVRELVGDHVRHNVYFKEFPNNVPDTEEFWRQCIVDALFDPRSASNIALQMASGVINLLDLPKYGKYLHSYEDMLSAHEQFIPHVKDRITFLHLGGTLVEEAATLYHSLAGSVIPLNDKDQLLLIKLADLCRAESLQPTVIPIRENRAIINQVRLEMERPLLVDTVTDVLRLAAGLSGGDITLTENTRFKSFSRSTRRAMLKALDTVIADNPAKLQDVNRYPEQWKRLGERLHPHEYSGIEGSKVFSVARGEMKARTLASKVESAFDEKDIRKVLGLLEHSPGTLFRNLDRILRNASKTEISLLMDVVQIVIGKVSGRVILSVSEHLQNRSKLARSRVFTNSKNKAWATSDTRISLPKSRISRLIKIFNTEISRRIQKIPRLVVDPEVLSLALPLSDKNKAGGFGIMPRGSILPVESKILRFFIYWKERDDRTDYDLSGLLLKNNFTFGQQLSWTRLRGEGAVHSGDITSSRGGASEFIDIDLSAVKENYIVPQINIYSGEAFDKVEECFFGFMGRSPEQMGQPFEARTVRMKSDLRGKGKVALPLVFIRDKETNRWSVKWLHLYLTGSPRFNRVEANKLSTTLLVDAIVNREYISMEHLVKLMRPKARTFTWYPSDKKLTKPVTYIGLETPTDLPEGSKVYTLTNLHELIPE